MAKKLSIMCMEKLYNNFSFDDQLLFLQSIKENKTIISNISNNIYKVKYQGITLFNLYIPLSIYSKEYVKDKVSKSKEFRSFFIRDDSIIDIIGWPDNCILCLGYKCFHTGKETSLSDEEWYTIANLVPLRVKNLKIDT
jgi:hypothetical protein